MEQLSVRQFQLRWLLLDLGAILPREMPPRKKPPQTPDEVGSEAADKKKQTRQAGGVKKVTARQKKEGATGRLSQTGRKPVKRPR